MQCTNTKPATLRQGSLHFKSQSRQEHNYTEQQNQHSQPHNQSTTPICEPSRQSNSKTSSKLNQHGQQQQSKPDYRENKQEPTQMANPAIS
jgi:hypothetical protein